MFSVVFLQFLVLSGSSPAGTSSQVVMSLGCDWLRTGPTSDAQVSPQLQASAPSSERHIQEAVYCLLKSTAISPGPTWGHSRHFIHEKLTEGSIVSFQCWFICFKIVFFLLQLNKLRIKEPVSSPRSCRAAPAPRELLRYRRPGSSSSGRLTTTWVFLSMKIQ